jgi:steroid delta-isomerase-like uncharacterized protein
MDNEQIIRKVYEAAEIQDSQGFAAGFTDDGVFHDMSSGTLYKGHAELGAFIGYFASIFPDMHRELYRFYLSGDTVVAELSLNGPLPTPYGIVPPTGRKMSMPCCDVFTLKDGKVKVFNCYWMSTPMLAQLGVLSNLEAAIAH